MDPLDFLDGDAPVETNDAVKPAVEPAPEPTAEPPKAEGPVRGPDGKFASRTAEAPTANAAPQAPATPPEAAQTPTEPPRPPEGFVPVSALHAEREKRQALERQYQQQPPPDPYEDFEAYQGWQEAQITAERADWSRQLAEVKYGADVVDQARAWAFERAESDPIFRQQSAMQRDPYGFAIEAWKRDQVLTKLSDPGLIDKFLAFAGGQSPTQVTATPAPIVAPPPQPSPPPRSIASAPNAGAAKPGEIQPGSAFDMVFKE